MQRPFENLSAEDRRVYRRIVRGLIAGYATALAIVAGMIVDHQVTQATARNEASSVSAQSAQSMRSVDARSFKQSLKFD